MRAPEDRYDPMKLNKEIIFVSPLSISTNGSRILFASSDSFTIPTVPPRDVWTVLISQVVQTATMEHELGKKQRTKEMYLLYANMSLLQYQR